MMTVDTPPRIEIEAEVLDYISSAMTDHFEDKRFAVFDAAVLAVRRPTDIPNPRLIVYLPQPTVVNSPWRRIGLRVIFQIAPEMLVPGTVIFEGAIHDLRVTKGSGARDGEAGNE
jgi:hypothetical protein